jgi:hypothetical protein
MPQPLTSEVSRGPRVLPHAPVELTQARLTRLGEGIGKVVYGSEHWVVKRERSPTEIIALIIIWKFLRKLTPVLPRWLAGQLENPTKQMRLLRVITQTCLFLVPQGVWFRTHIGEVSRAYHWNSVRGETLAQAHLTGTELVPERVLFPPTRVKVRGWPRWLLVHEATERVETTLYQRLAELGAAGRFEELERWLDRLLELRQIGWRRGLFSVDTHLKNFGVSGDHLVLLDTGGLTNTWADIERRLSFEETITQPHQQLGLGPILKSRPDIAARFDAHWKSIVNIDYIQLQWLGDL